MTNGFPIIAGEQNFVSQGTKLFAQAPQNGIFSSGPIAFVGPPLNEPLEAVENLDGIIASGNGGGVGVVGWGGALRPGFGSATGPGPGVVGAGGVGVNQDTAQQGGDGVVGLGGSSSNPFLTENVPSGDGLVGFAGNGAPGYTTYPDGQLAPPLVYSPFPGGDGVYAVGGDGSSAANIPSNAVDGQDANAGVGVRAFGGLANGLALGGSGVVGVALDPFSSGGPFEISQGIGVAGLGPLGVYGFSEGEVAIYGVTCGSAHAAILGINNASLGQGEGGGACGVMGVGSVGGHGVIGQVSVTNTPADESAYAVWGRVEGSQPTTGGPYAGWFNGPVEINGPLTVNGAVTVMGANVKSVAIPFPDGSHRRLYCMESPECWFEDFGDAELVKGKAQVKLPRDFASAIKTGSYHVFLAPYGSSNGLYVSKRTRQGFVVTEQGKGKSNLKFSFRIVGKRKDLSAERFAKVSMPKVPQQLKLPTLPKLLDRKRKAELPRKPRRPLSGNFSALSSHGPSSAPKS